MLLVSFFGAGVQLFGMAIVTIVLAMLGMLSPSSRGSLLNASFALYVLMGLVCFSCISYLFNFVSYLVCLKIFLTNIPFYLYFHFLFSV